jgi:hypothetical protein
MASPKLVRSLAKTVAATAFGGPLAGAGAAVDAAIDLVVGQLDQQDKDVYSAAIRRLEGGAKAFARSEGLSEAAADRSLTEAQLLIARHGPSVGDMVAADLDPGRVSELVLRRGARELRLLGEGDEELCRRVVRSVYDALLLDTAGLPGVEAAFRRAVLATLRTLPADVADAVRVAVRDIVANLPATESPAAGLPPADLRELYQGVFERHALFAGRERELAILDGAVAMVRDQDAGRYVCVSGAAGLGKSALLVNWVRRLDADDRVAYVFINRLAGTAEELPTLQALCQQLLPPAERAVPLPADATDLRARVRRLLATSPEHRPSIVVIDGLDEADWMPSALVPLVPPPGRAIVLSRRATSDAWVRELGLARDSVTPITLETLGVDEVARLLEAAGGAAAQLAKDPVFVEKLHRVAVYEAGGERPGGDPLYVRLLVDDVRERRILSADDLDRHSDGLYAYFDGWWEEITGALSGAVLRDLLGYLLVAKGPIARAELVAISADDALDEFGGENVLPFATVRARARRFVLGDDSGLALAHPRFEAYLRSTRFDSTLTDDYAARIAPAGPTSSVWVRTRSRTTRRTCTTPARPRSSTTC